MSKTVTPAGQITARPSLPAAARPRPTGLWFWAKKLLEILASLKLTVVLFTLAIALIFFGTMAQREEGTWTVLHRYFRTGIAWIPFQIFARFAQVFFNLFPKARWPGSFPFPGGWLLGALLLFNLLAAHIVRFRVSWERAGILLLHAGLAVLMISELVTGVFSVEWQMPLKEGGSSSFLQDPRKLELAFVSSAGPNQNNVAVIPGRLLRPGEWLQDPDLPFDVEVVQLLRNSELRNLKAGEKNPATAGDGVSVKAVEQPPVPGTSQDDEDRASVYVSLFEKPTAEALRVRVGAGGAAAAFPGFARGTYLVSTFFNDDNPLSPMQRPQKVKMGGKEYEVSLRSKRAALPYTVHLLEFRHDTYMGTEEVRNYSSRIRLVDPRSGTEREVVISMNKPLRYEGRTFYQAGWLPGFQGTILQVVDNPGWLVPYISCAMIALGLLFHFGLHLVGFLRRRAAL